MSHGEKQRKKTFRAWDPVVSIKAENNMYFLAMSRLTGISSADCDE